MYDFYIFVGTKNIITSLLLTLFGLWESYIYIYISVYVYNKTILKNNGNQRRVRCCDFVG